MLALGGGLYLPFVESCGTFLTHHGESTAGGAAVLARGGIHEAGFDNVHRRRHYGGAEARTEGRGEVARKIICQNRQQKLSGVLRLCLYQPAGGGEGRFVLTRHQVILEDQLFDQVIGHQLSTVYNGIAGDVGKAT